MDSPKSKGAVEFPMSGRFPALRSRSTRCAPGPSIAFASLLMMAAAPVSPLRAEEVSTGTTEPRTAVQERIRAGNYSEAEALARQALADAAGDTIPEAAALDVLVGVLRKQGKANVPETRSLAERSLRLREARFGPDAPETASSLMVYGGLLVELSKPAEALDPLERALEINERHFGIDDLRTASAWMERGLALSSAGRIDEASSALLRSQSIYAAHGRDLTDAQRLEQSRTQLGIASIHLAKGKLAEAEQAATQCLAARERILGPDHPDVLYALNVLGIIHRRLERWLEARSCYERALAIADAKLPPTHSMRAQLLSNLAGVLWSAGSSRDALSYALRAYELRQQTLPPDHPDLTQSLHNLGMLHADLGNPARALEYFQRAITGYEASLGPDHPRLWPLLWKTAEVLGELGRAEEGLALSERALAVGRKAGLEGSPDYGTNLEVQASLLRILGRCDAARPLMEQSIALIKAAYGAEHPEVGREEMGLATLLAAMGDPAAGEIAMRADELGRQFLRLSTHALSETESMEFARVRPSGSDLLVSLAVAATETETDARAEDAAKVDDAAVSQVAIRRAWDSILRSRALVLDETARWNRPTLAPKEASAPLREAERRRADASRELANLLVRGPDEKGPEAHDAAIDSARTRLQKVERDLQALSASFRVEATEERAGLAEVAAALPPNSALVAFARYRPWAVGTCGGSEEPPRYTAFVLPSASADPVLVELGSAVDIDALVTQWRQAVGRPAATGTDEDSRRVGTELSARIWEPIAPHCARAQRVYLVPDGALNRVNYDALPSAQGPFLAESGPLLTLLSAERDLIPREDLVGSPSPDRGFLAFGDPDFDRRSRTVSGTKTTPLAAGMEPSWHPFRGPTSPCLDFARIHWRRLPATSEEVEAVARIWKRSTGSQGHAAGPSARVLTGDEASEGALKRLAPGSEILHVATHGFFLDGRCSDPDSSARGLGGYVGGTSGAGVTAAAEATPAAGVTAAADAVPEDASTRPLRLSGLVLAGANLRGQVGADGEDGILTAEEIATLDLRGMRCVILSACDTGIGEFRESEGILGLRRAFRAAGARDVVMSLWSVDDESSRAWMEALYHAMAEHEGDAALAVRQASLEILAERRRSGLSTEPFYWAGFVAVVGSL